MRSLLIICLVFLVLPVCAQDETKLVKDLKAKLDKVNDYKATGKMKIDVSFINVPPASINVFYKKPNKFKVKKVKGISIIPKSGVSININSLLSNDNYKAVSAGQKEVSGIVTKAVMLIPMQENSEVVLMTLYIDEKNLLLLKTSITTRENGSYEIDMSYGKYSSWGLPDKVIFSFNTKDYKLPKGLTLEYEKGGKKKDAKIKNKKGSVEITYSSYVINKGVDEKEFSPDKS